MKNYKGQGLKGPGRPYLNFQAEIRTLSVICPDSDHNIIIYEILAVALEPNHD